ncbi:ATP10 protein-domain-containing protein [Mucor lusitanicus]|uniref:ATP10 protein-domain-containing protein n=2 Tax=Mucor circinelloides f. lusitanicus TaxID=29924 RepID=A0A8H4BPP5_MUCCL|nr:ATP10 protein-domain-containing protein [Mucor lusitanicus]
MLRTNRLLASNLAILNRQSIRAIAIQQRCLSTDQKPAQEQPAPEKYGKFRSPPTSLGVSEPPVVDHNNWLQRKKQKLRDFVDYEKAFAAHAAERRYLVEEATKSYFADVHEMRQHGGKMYFASSQLVKPEKAGYMPNFEAQDLSRQKINTTEKLVGKTTLMTFVYAKFGEPHVNTFIKPFLEKYKDQKDIQVVEVNVQENMLKQLLLKAFVPSIRKNLPAERKENYCLILKDISRTRKCLDMTNQYVGYAFLVDENCKIRWTAHGEATAEEVGNMLAMTDYLHEKKLSSDNKNQ